MNFVIGFSRTSQDYVIVWVVVNRHTKPAHFFPIQIRHLIDKLA